VAWKGGITRLSYKMPGMMNIARTDQISGGDGTIADTLMDLAIYALITRILYEDFKRCNI